MIGKGVIFCIKKFFKIIINFYKRKKLIFFNSLIYLNKRKRIYLYYLFENCFFCLFRVCILDLILLMVGVLGCIIFFFLRIYCFLFGEFIMKNLFLW